MGSLRSRGFTPGRLLAVAFVVCLPMAEARANDWFQYNGNLGDRASTETIGTIDWSVSSPPLPDWEIPITNGFSSFSVVDGKMYTTVSRVHTDMVTREFCVAYDAASGTELWAMPMSPASYASGATALGEQDGPRSTPTCDGERVYVLDNDLRLYCFDVGDGHVVWSKNIMTEYSGRTIGYDCAASPLLEGESVVVPGGGNGQGFLAFNRTDGVLAWASNVNEYMTQASPVAATIHGVRQIVFLVQHRLISVNAATGVELWRYTVGYATAAGASPVVCNGNYVYHSTSYSSGEGGVCRIDWDGANFSAVEIWRTPYPTLSNHWSTAVYYDGYIYGLYGHAGPTTYNLPLKCVDLMTGTVMWSHSDSGVGDFGPGGLMRVGDKVVVLAANGNVVVVQATSTAYTEITRADMLDGKCWSSPVLSDNRLYIRSITQGKRFPFSTIATPTPTPAPSGARLLDIYE
ncbi:PQQ-like beta-propeller repeat protein [Candidatus Sumerlaeota bacterium]|nr:PQQ-like beta-propeller repeat protein [Candidatus Sumerlaeota bacterium]